MLEEKKKSHIYFSCLLLYFLLTFISVSFFPSSYLVGQLLINHLLLPLIAVFITKYFFRLTFFELLDFSIPKKVHVKILFWGLIAILLSIIPYVIIGKITGYYVEHPVKDIFSSGGFNFFELIIIGIIVIVAAPFTEELLLRRFFYKLVAELVNIRIAIIITSLFFAWLHFNNMAFISYFIIGMVLQWVYLREKNLFYPILLHGIYNAIQFLTMIFMEI